MSFEDEFHEFMAGQDIDPESVFTMVTLMPKRKMRIKAYLEDEDGEKVLLKDLAQEVIRYIEDHMNDEESSSINSQIFPLINQFMVSVVPRASDIRVAEFMFTASAMRKAISYFGMAVFLLGQYIHQHNLKIVTEEETVTDEELEAYFERAQAAEEALFNAIGATRGNPDDVH